MDSLKRKLIIFYYMQWSEIMPCHPIFRQPADMNEQHAIVLVSQ